MKARTLVLVAGVAIAAAAGFALSGLASGADVSPTASVCIKPNGQLRAITPANPVCVAPEEETEWTVKGVKAIVAGAGLVGRDDGGLVHLQVDPGLVENANGGKIVAGFDDGPHEVPDDLLPIAQLPLQPGNYAIFAKLVFRYLPGSGPHTVADVNCRLFAGADSDEIHAVLEPFDADKGLAGLGSNGTAQSLEVVHRFDSTSRAVLACSDSSVFYPGGGVDYVDLKLIAIRGSSLSNTFVGLEAGQ